MIRSYIFFLCFGALVISCQKDDPVVTPDPLPNTLHYDGPNQSAPVFAQGVSYAGVRFSSSVVERYGHTGKSINSITFFIAEVPDVMRLLIFADNGARRNEPGDLMYEYQFMQGEINPGSWNDHLLDNAMAIPAEGVWVVMEVDASDQRLAIIGCDPGPRQPEGDIYGLFGDNNPGWFTFYEFSNRSVDINWNIRANVQ